MAIRKGFRFPVSFAEAFPMGCLLMGEIEPAWERQSMEDRSRGREPRQRIDPESGLPVWQAKVNDPAALRNAEAAVTVDILSAERPAMPEVLAGVSIPVAEVVFTGVTALPTLGGSGEIRWITYRYQAAGIEPARQGQPPSAAAGKLTGAPSKAGAAGKDAGSPGGEGR